MIDHPKLNREIITKNIMRLLVLLCFISFSIVAIGQNPEPRVLKVIDRIENPLHCYRAFVNCVVHSDFSSTPFLFESSDDLPSPDDYTSFYKDEWLFNLSTRKDRFRKTNSMELSHRKRTIHLEEFTYWLSIDCPDSLKDIWFREFKMPIAGMDTAIVTLTPNLEGIAPVRTKAEEHYNISELFYSADGNEISFKVTSYLIVYYHDKGWRVLDPSFVDDKTIKSVIGKKLFKKANEHLNK